jgi:hypothetical protein
LTPVPGLASTTAAGLARKLTEGQWAAVETGLGDVHATALELLGRVDPDRARALSAEVTIDLDTTDVEVYGRRQRGVAFNHQGQRVGRPHVATWADTSVVLAADLGSGREDPGRAALMCWAGRWPRSRLGRGRGGSDDVLTPDTSPGSSPAPPCSPTWSSPSGPDGPRRCGGCWTAWRPRGGPTRSA